MVGELWISIKDIITSILHFLLLFVKGVIAILLLILLVRFLPEEHSEEHQTRNRMIGQTRKIGYAVQQGSWVYVYDENGHSLFSHYVGRDPGDGLKGYTNSTVTIQKNGFIYVYDSKNRCIRTFRAR